MKNKEYFKLLLPIIFEQFFLTFMTMIGTLILSGVSDDAVAASGMSNQIIIIGIMLLNIIGVGTTILLTQLMGKTDIGNVRRVQYNSLFLGFIFSLIIAGIMYLFALPLLRLIKTPSNIIDMALIYLKIVSISIIPQGLITVFTSILRSYKKVSSILIITILTNLINLAGLYIVIFSKYKMFGTGVIGVANVTLLSRIVGMIIFALHYMIFIKKGGKVNLSKEVILKILKYGVPSGLENVAYNLSQTIISAIIAILGSTLISARIYTITIMSFVFAFSVSIAMAVQICVGHLIGQGKKEEALNFVNYRSKRGFIFIITLATLIALISPKLVPILTKDQSIIAIVPTLCFISILLEPLRCLNVTRIYSLTAGGDVKYPMMVGIIIIYLVNIPLSYIVVLKLHYGLIGLFCCAIFDEFIRSTLFRIRWNKKGWMKLDVTAGLN